MRNDDRPQTTDDRQKAVSNNSDTSVVSGRWSVVKLLAHVFSYLFHPLFIPLYVICFLVAFHPSYFSGFGMYEKNKLVFIVVLNTVFFPAFSVVLMRALGFIKSIFLRTPQDRIGPYLSSMIFYFWTAWVFFKTSPQLPLILPVFMTGVFLTTVVGLLSNIYFKISMHAMGMGGLLGIFLLVMKSNTMLMTWPLCLAFLIAGIVCTSRLLVSDHTAREIYLGLAAGILCQFIAALAIL